MDTGRWLEALARDGEALVAAAEAAGPSVAVPCCPDWDVAELVGHVGEVHRAWELVVARRLQRFDAPLDIPIPDREARVPWYREGLGHLLRTLHAVDPEEPIATWTGLQPARWIQRRMALETLVHRWDAESALGAPAPLDADLAADGVDEVLGVMLPVRPPSGTWTAHLHATDVPGEWLVAAGGGRVELRREHAKGDLAVRGPAEALLLWLWGRAPLDDPRLETFGDLSVAPALLERAGRE